MVFNVRVHCVGCAPAAAWATFCWRSDMSDRAAGQRVGAAASSVLLLVNLEFWGWV